MTKRRVDSNNPFAEKRADDCRQTDLLYSIKRMRLIAMDLLLY